MRILLSIFSNDILPIFLAAGAGFLAGKIFKINTQSVSDVAFHVFGPCMIFSILTTSPLANQDIAKMIIFSIVSIFLLGGVTWIFGKLLKLNRKILAAVLLIAMFGNVGNFGLSLNLFAFGEEALAFASIYFVISSILMYSLGVVIASSGRNNIKTAALGLVKLPASYAVIFSLIYNVIDWHLPLPLERTITILADGAIPTLMIVFGMQLSKIKLKGQHSNLAFAAIMRLITGPAIALVVSLIIGLSKTAHQAGISQSGMPTAVMITILAIKYDLEPSFVTAGVLITTILSPLTITPLLAFLGA